MSRSPDGAMPRQRPWDDASPIFESLVADCICAVTGHFVSPLRRDNPRLYRQADRKGRQPNEPRLIPIIRAGDDATDRGIADQRQK